MPQLGAKLRDALRAIRPKHNSRRTGLGGIFSLATRTRQAEAELVIAQEKVQVAVTAAATASAAHEEEIRELKNQRDRLAARLDTIAETLCARDEQVRQLQGVFDASATQACALSKKLIERDGEVMVLQKDLHARDEKLSCVESDRTLARVGMEVAQRRTAVVEAFLSTTREERDEFKRSWKSVEDERDQLKRECDKAKNEYARALSLVTSLSAEVASNERTVQKLQLTVSTAANASVTDGEKIRELMSQREGLAARLDTTAESLCARDEQVRQLQGVVEASAARECALSRKLTERDGEVTALQKDLHARDKKLSSVESDCKVARAEMEVAHRHTAEVEAILSTTREERDEFKRSWKSVEGDRDRLKRECDKAKNEYACASSLATSLSAEAVSQKRAVQELQISSKATNERLQCIEADRDEERSKRMLAERDAKALKGQLCTTLREHDVQVEELDASREECIALTRRAEELTCERNDSERRVAALQLRNKAAEEHVKQLRADAAELVHLRESYAEKTQAFEEMAGDMEDLRRVYKEHIGMAFASEI